MERGIAHFTGSFIAPPNLSRDLGSMIEGTLRRSGFFAHYFLSAFIFAKTQKGRLTQMAVASPFGKADLADEFGSYPGAAAHFGRSKPAAMSAGLLRKI